MGELWGYECSVGQLPAISTTSPCLLQQQLHFSSCSLKIRDAGLAAPPVQVEALGEILSLLDSLVLCHWAGERGNSPTRGALNIYRPLRC